MIKISLKRNLLYLLALYISNVVRKVISIIIDEIFHLNAPFIFLYMMSMGEIIGGSAIYIYQILSWKKKKDVKYFRVNVIQEKTSNNLRDGKFKIILLLFLSSFFDFFAFILLIFYSPKNNISQTIVSRLSSLETISASLICTYALKFKIGKHHNFSLIMISLFLLVTFIIELLYKSNAISIGRFFFVHFLICIRLISLIFTACIERYLAIYNFINPFLILFAEGIFVFIISFFYSINKSPFKEIMSKYEEINTSNFMLLIFMLFLYFICSGLLNSYKIYCNVIYTPMARTLIDYFFNPFFNIYYFIVKDDFCNNFLYFLISEIFCIIIDFFGCVYNEYIILFCCGLEHDTSDAIIERSLEKERFSNNTINIENDDYILYSYKDSDVESNELNIIS